MCKIALKAFEGQVLSFVVSWCCSATPADLDDLTARLRESCSRTQRVRVSAVMQEMAERIVP
jgi:hypothetical protein